MRKTVQEPAGNGSSFTASKGLVGPAVLCYPGLSKALVAPFLLDLIWIHMEKRSPTPDPSLGEFLWTAGWWGAVRGRECSAHCETFPLAATQEFLWEPQVLLACVVLKQTLSVPQKISSALIICTRWRGQLQHWLLWFIPALLPRFILLPAKSHRGCSNTAEI